MPASPPGGRDYCEMNILYNAGITVSPRDHLDVTFNLPNRIEIKD
jgi:hypothetical protein